MAIDFMVMGFSRYLSGDFVTPAMTAGWASNVPYAILGPQGRRELPPGVPFGGADAAQNRVRFQGLLAEDLKALPDDVQRPLWDEASTDACFHRVDARSYEALLAFAREPVSEKKPGLMGLLGAKSTRPRHLAATIYLPMDFETPFLMQSPFVGRLTGSSSRALAELDGRLPDDAGDAVRTLRAALADSLRVKLPMIVDA